MIRNLTATIATIAALATAGTIYPATMIATDAKNDIVTLETSTGYVYQFEGVEDYADGDLITCIMFDNFTPNDIKDDVIISHRYSGFFENK